MRYTAVVNIVQTIASGLVLALLALACSERGERGEGWVVRYQEIVDEACACREIDCFQQFKAEHAEFYREFAAGPLANNQSTLDRLKKLDNKWDVCELEDERRHFKQRYEREKQQQALNRRRDLQRRGEELLEQLRAALADLKAAETDAERAKANARIITIERRLESLGDPPPTPPQKKPPSTFYDCVDDPLC